MFLCNLILNRFRIRFISGHVLVYLIVLFLFFFCSGPVRFFDRPFHVSSSQKVLSLTKDDVDQLFIETIPLSQSLELSEVLNLTFLIFFEMWTHFILDIYEIWRDLGDLCLVFKLLENSIEFMLFLKNHHWDTIVHLLLISLNYWDWVDEIQQICWQRMDRTHVVKYLFSIPENILQQTPM